MALFSKRGVDVDIADASGYNALMRAIIGNQLGAVEILLKAGAKIQYRSKAGSTMLMLAAGAEDMRESFGRTDLGTELCVNLESIASGQTIQYLSAAAGAMTTSR